MWCFSSLEWCFVPGVNAGLELHCRAMEDGQVALGDSFNRLLIRRLVPELHAMQGSF